MNLNIGNFFKKSLLQIFIIALFFSSTNITSAATGVSSNQIYTNDRFGYQISYPKSWKKSDEVSFLDEMNKIESSIALYEKDKKYTVKISVDRNPPSFTKYLNEKTTTVLIGSTATVAYINPLPGPCAAKGNDCSYMNAAIYYNGLWYRLSAYSNVTMSLDVYKDIFASFKFEASKKSDSQKLKSAKKAEKKIDSLMKKLKKTADADVKEYYKRKEMEDAINKMHGYTGISVGSHLCGNGYTNRTLFPVGSQITCSDVFAPYAVKVAYTNEMNVTKYWCIDSTGAKLFKIKTDPVITHDTNCDDNDDDFDKNPNVAVSSLTYTRASNYVDENINKYGVTFEYQDKSACDPQFANGYEVSFGDGESVLADCKGIVDHVYKKDGIYTAKYTKNNGVIKSISVVINNTK